VTRILRCDEFFASEQLNLRGFFKKRKGTGAAAVWELLISARRFCSCYGWIPMGIDTGIPSNRAGVEAAVISAAANLGLSCNTLHPDASVTALRCGQFHAD
jgi:hypothetical protein